jgi:hypothetical protein
MYTYRVDTLYIFKNVRTEYFKNAAHSVFPLQNSVYFIILIIIIIIIIIIFINCNWVVTRWQ